MGQYRMKLFFIVLGLLVSVYLVIMLLAFHYQERIIFPGSTLPQNHEFLAEPYLYEKTIDVEGAVLSALHFQQPEARGLIFFLHGNAGNLESWLPDVDFYRREKYDLFMIDYRVSTSHMEATAACQ